MGYTGPTIALPVRGATARQVCERARRIFVVPRPLRHCGLVAIYNLDTCAYAALTFFGGCRSFTATELARFTWEDRRWVREAPIRGYLLILLCPSPIEPVVALRPQLYERVEDAWAPW